MNKYLKYLSLCLAAGLVFMAPDALATSPTSNPSYTVGYGGDNVFNTTLSVMIDTFRNVRAVVYVAGGFALVGMAVASMLGKLAWKWLAAVAIALAIVAMAGAIVDYATGQGSRSTSGTVDLADTLRG